MNGRVLIIAGSDPSGGAGIQADIKTVTALGGYAMSAISALTVQDTQSVHDVMLVAPDFVAKQIKVVLHDIGADVIKIGMIGNIDIAHAVYEVLKSEAGHIPIVLDPVMGATSGDRLADEGLSVFIKDKLMALDNIVITPNIDELEILSNRTIKNVHDMRSAGRALLKKSSPSLLLKGGHLKTADLVDILLFAENEAYFHHALIETSSTHGTGCTLASALATGLAQGLDLFGAAKQAIYYVQKAIGTAPDYGNGHGPLNHAHPIHRRKS